MPIHRNGACPVDACVSCLSPLNYYSWDKSNCFSPLAPLRGSVAAAIEGGGATSFRMAFVTDLLANNFVANKIGSAVPLFRDDDEDNTGHDGEADARSKHHWHASRAADAAGGRRTGMDGAGTSRRRADALTTSRSSIDGAPDAGDADAGARGKQAPGDHGDVDGEGFESTARVAPGSTSDSWDEGRENVTDDADVDVFGTPREDGDEVSGARQWPAVSSDDVAFSSPDAGEDDTRGGGDVEEHTAGTARDEDGDEEDGGNATVTAEASEDEKVTQGDIDWLIQEMENLQNDMEFLEEEELWERLNAIERENQRIMAICGKAPIKMGGGGGQGARAGGMAGEVLGVVDGLGSLLLTTAAQAKEQREKAAELRRKIEKQTRDREVLRGLDEWCDSLPEGGGATNRSDWAARGFVDPVTGYNRLRIHKPAPMIKPKAENGLSGNGVGTVEAGAGGREASAGAREVIASLEQKFPEPVRPSSAPDDLAKKAEESRLRALAEEKGKKVLQSIDRALGSIQSGAQTIAANTAGGAAESSVAAALAWFGRQSDGVKRAFAGAFIFLVVLTFVVQHEDDEEMGLAEEIDQGIGVSGRRLLLLGGRRLLRAGGIGFDDE